MDNEHDRPDQPGNPELKTEAAPSDEPSQASSPSAGDPGTAASPALPIETPADTEPIIPEVRSEETPSAASDQAPAALEGPGEEAARGPEVPRAPGMIRVIGVKFRRAGKTYFFNAGYLRFNIGEQVIVETDRGLGLVRVVTPVVEIAGERLPADLKKVIRKAHWNDLERDRKNKEREAEALKLCSDRIHGRNLPMKLVQVEYLHDASKAIFYFTAESRVDFRDLVKDLAHQLHTRIEMRQIGVRDESKLIGGLGPCGREACCTAFLSDFSPVSVRMAKDQNLAMNPTKVSGLCGRLMCCLAYEHPLYQELIKKMPKKGKCFQCSQGNCRVVDLNILTQKVMVELESGKITSVPVTELRKLDRAPEGAPAQETEEEEELSDLMESDDPTVLEKMEKKGEDRPRRPPENARPQNHGPRPPPDRNNQRRENHRPPPRPAAPPETRPYPAPGPPPENQGPGAPNPPPRPGDAPVPGPSGGPGPGPAGPPPGPGGPGQDHHRRRRRRHRR